jgi:hypothetical protein
MGFSCCDSLWLPIHQPCCRVPYHDWSTTVNSNSTQLVAWSTTVNSNSTQLVAPSPVSIGAERSHSAGAHQRIYKHSTYPTCLFVTQHQESAAHIKPHQQPPRLKLQNPTKQTYLSKRTPILTISTCSDNSFRHGGFYP